MSAEYIEDKQVLKESAELLPVLTKEIQERLENTVMTTNDKLRDLIKTGYYNRVSITFRCLIYEAILFFEATHEELDILSAVGSRTIFCYIEAFDQIARTANSLNTSLRFSWKTDSYPDDYSSESILVLSEVYSGIADMFQSLERLDNLSEVLEEEN